MEWQIFAIVQMFVIMLGVSLAFWSRTRTAFKENAALREHFAALEEQAPNETTESPETWVQGAIDALDASDPHDAVTAMALRQALTPADDFSEQLQAHLQASGLITDTDSGEETAALQAEVEKLKSALDQATAGEDEVDGTRATELKMLLQQFTRDSREMMGCIETLERENQLLRSEMEKAGLEPPPAATPDKPATPTQSAEATPAPETPTETAVATPEPETAPESADASPAPDQPAEPAAESAAEETDATESDLPPPGDAEASDASLKTDTEAATEEETESDTEAETEADPDADTEHAA